MNAFDRMMKICLHVIVVVFRKCSDDESCFCHARKTKVLEYEKATLEKLLLVQGCHETIDHMKRRAATGTTSSGAK